MEYGQLYKGNRMIKKLNLFLNEKTRKKNYKGKQYEVWEGQDGLWFWSVLQDPVNLHGQKASSEKEAIQKVKERIDKLVSGAKWKASF